MLEPIILSSCCLSQIHLSFSVTGGKSEGKAAFQSEVLQLFLQSVGVVLTDVQDIVFRIAYFERNFVFYEQTALAKDIQRHYTQQVSVADDMVPSL